MTKRQFEIPPRRDEKDPLSDSSNQNAAADQPISHLSPGLFQRIIVASYRAPSARKIRYASRGIEPDRLYAISLDRRYFDRTTENVAVQVSRACARFLKKLQCSADQATASINSPIKYLTRSGEMPR